MNDFFKNKFICFDSTDELSRFINECDSAGVTSSTGCLMSERIPASAYRNAVASCVIKISKNNIAMVVMKTHTGSSDVIPFKNIVANIIQKEFDMDQMMRLLST